MPINIIGTSKGVKKGGILETFVRDIEIECLPKDIPDSITIDVSELDVGDSLHTRDIEFDEKLKVLTNPEQVVVTVGTPTKIEVPIEEVEEEVVPVEGEEVIEKEEPEKGPETKEGEG